MIKLIFMYTRPKLTISTKKKKFKKNCLKKVCKLGILGHSGVSGIEEGSSSIESKVHIDKIANTLLMYFLLLQTV